MALWPGQAGNQPFDAMGLKQIYYNQRMDSWKLNFLERGLDFSEPTYTLEAMIRQFDLLE